MSIGHERKLSDEAIADIQENCGQACPCCGFVRTQAAFARKYKVSPTLISFVVNKRKHFAKK